MGIDITAVFQRQDGQRWVDVPSEYDELRDYSLYAWLGMDYRRLGLKPLPVHEGVPADFEMVDEAHPSPLPRSQVMPWKSNPVSMGWGLHWVLVDDVLAATPPRERRTIAIALEDFRSWDGRRQPAHWQIATDDWRERSLQRGEPAGYYASPTEIVAGTRHVVCDYEHDYGESWRDFLDELHRLKALHGRVRMVYGFY